MDDKTSLRILWGGCQDEAMEFRDNSICPLCREAEDNINILKYTIEDTSDRWATSIADLEQNLSDNHAPPHTVDMIVYQIQSWRKGTGTIPKCTSPSLTSTVVAQNRIGWQALME